MNIKKLHERQKGTYVLPSDGMGAPTNWQISEKVNEIIEYLNSSVDDRHLGTVKERS